MPNAFRAAQPFLQAFSIGSQAFARKEEAERAQKAQQAAIAHQQQQLQLEQQAQDLKQKQALYQAGLAGPTELKALGKLLGVDDKAPYFQSLVEMAKSSHQDKATIFGSMLGLQPGSPQLQAFMRNPELGFQALTAGMEMKEAREVMANKAADTALKRQKLGMIDSLMGGEGIGGGSGTAGQDRLSVEQAAGLRAAGVPGAELLATTGVEVRKQEAEFEAARLKPLSPRQKRVLGISTPGKVTPKELEGQFIVPDDETTKELEASTTAVREMDMLAKRAQGILEKQGGKVLSVSGALNSAVNSVRAQAIALLESAGGGVDINRGRHRQQVNGIADSLLSDSKATSAEKAKLGSVILDLAIAAMAVKGQSGRQLSDKDLAAQLDALGRNPDPAVFQATLQDVVERSWNRVAISHAQATSPGAAGPMEVRRSMQIIGGAEIPTFSEPAQTEGTGYPDGTVIVNPQTGEELVSRGGQWVPR